MPSISRDIQQILALAPGFSATISSSGAPAANTLLIESGSARHPFNLPPGIELRVVASRTYDAIASAAAAVVASGTATVETALLGTPFVVVYRVGRITELLLRAFVRTSHVAMPNLIAGREVVPELLQQDCTGPNISAQVLRLLQSAEARAEVQQGLAEVRARLGQGGAIERGAEIIARLV